MAHCRLALLRIIALNEKLSVKIAANVNNLVCWVPYKILNHHNCTNYQTATDEKDSQANCVMNTSDLYLYHISVDWREKQLLQKYLLTSNWEIENNAIIVCLKAPVEQSESLNYYGLIVLIRLMLFKLFKVTILLVFPMVLLSNN
jgi:hypothetical protein